MPVVDGDRVRLAIAALALTACGSDTDRSKPPPTAAPQDARAARRDGDWQPLTGGPAVAAAGGLADGTLWFAGTADEGWVRWIGPEAAARDATFPAVGVVGAAATPSGDVWVADLESHDSQLRLVRIDRETGEAGAPRRFPYDVGADLYDLDTRGDAVVAVGLHNPIVSGLVHGWVLSASADGLTASEVKLGRHGYSFLMAGVPLADGGVATVGKLDDVSALAIVDADGRETRFAPLFGGEDSRADEVVELPGGDLLVIGFRVDHETVSTLAGRVVAERRGRDGTVRWSRTGDAAVAHVHGIEVVGDTVVALAASPGKQPSLLVVRVTADGAITTTPHDGPAMFDATRMAAFLVRGPGDALRVLQIDPATPRYRLSDL